MATILGFRHGYIGTAGFFGCPLLIAAIFLACRHYVLGSFSNNHLSELKSESSLKKIKSDRDNRVILIAADVF
jgi:hypothetical protein